jgi:type IV pilus assembly protein PilX
MSARTRLPARRQRGAILFVALVVLVAMSLAGIALMRSVDTNVLIAGNLAFRQGATAAGDYGVEEARKWIGANSTLLNFDQPNGQTYYWANWQQNLDLVGNNPGLPDYDWTSNAAKDLGADLAGNRVQYVIHRLCDVAGAPIPPVQCVKSSLSVSSAGAGGSNQVQPVGGGNVTLATVVLYRVTVRVTGPRNTVSFVQAVLH